MRRKWAPRPRAPTFDEGVHVVEVAQEVGVDDRVVVGVLWAE